MEMSDTRQGRLVDLTEDECWELVGSRPVGRIAWKGAHGISVIPVNHLVDGRQIVLRTTPYSDLAREGADHEVAFEVDDLDQAGHAGWSVLVRGQCRREERASDGVTPWASGRRVLGLRISAETVTGRRVQPS